MSIVTLNKLYSYRCTYCCLELDISLTDTDAIEGEISSLEYCPLCGSDNLVRDYKKENKSIIFKGKGFYSTDGRRE